MRDTVEEMGLHWFLMVLTVLLAANGCGGDATNRPGADLTEVPGIDVDGDPGDADDAEMPGTDVAVELPDVPPGPAILDRPVDLRFRCEVTRTATAPLPLRWASDAYAPVTTAGGRTFLVRREFDESVSSGYGPLVVSTFAPDGTLGAAIELPSDPTAELWGMGAVPAGDGFLATWLEAGSLRTALRNADGGAVADPRILEALIADVQSWPVAAPLGTGFALSWGAPEGEGRAVRVQRLDAAGTVAGSPVTLAWTPEPWLDPTPTIAAGDGRWGVLWREGDWTRGYVNFAAVDAAGNIVVPAKRLSVDEPNVRISGGEFGRARSALVPAGTGWLAAWAERRSGEAVDSGASVTIKVARLDGEGNVIEVAPVRPVTAEVEEVQPVLVPFGDHVALFWSSGSVIYICTHCSPHHRIDMVLLDPATLVPVSEPTSLVPSGAGGMLDPSGGFLDLQAAVTGDDFLMTFAERFHVSADPLSATVRCTPR